MRAWLSAWPKLILAAVLAVLAGVGGWLAVGSVGAGRSAPVSPGSPIASPSALPPLNLRALPDTGPAPRPATCGSPSAAGASGAWLPDWLDDPNRPGLIAEQARRLRLLDFYWAQLGAAPDSIVLQPDNPGASSLDTALRTAAAANPCGLRFVTVSDANTPKSVLARVLLDQQARWRNVSALADFMARYPQADGLTLDYEYALPRNQADLARYAEAGHWHDLTVREEADRIMAGYTELVRELSLAMHRQHRALRVSVMVRATDEIDYTDPSNIAPFLFDYGQLARYADQIVLMAIDFHWSTGDPGPIVTLADLRNVLKDARTYDIPAGRLSVESPVYGYDWTVDRAGHRLAGTQAATVTATDVESHGWQAVGGKDGETRYEYAANGRHHVIWFAGSGLKYQVSQLRTLCPGCGIMAWAAGNTDPAGSALIIAALGG